MRFRFALGAALFVLLVYSLSWSGLSHAVDELSALAVAESMVAGDGLRVDQMEWDQARTPPQNIAGLDGHLYSKKGLGVSLVALPGWLLGRGWEGMGAARGALLAGPILGALAAGALVWAALALGYGTGTAFVAGMALAFATTQWPYARTLFSEAPAATGLALAMAGAVAGRAEKRRGAWILCGAGLALLTLVKSSNAVLAPWFFLYWLAAEWPGAEERWRRLLRSGVALGAPFLAAVLATILYNYSRFGTLLGFPLEPFETFSTPLLTGLTGLLLSPGKGLMWYVPLAWLGVAGAVVALLRPQKGHLRRADVLLGLGSLMTPLLLYALWYDWPGGRSWGPRMVTWLVPALVLLALPLIENLFTGRRTVRMGVAAVLALSLLVQVPGVLVNFEVQEALDMKGGLSFDALLWQPQQSPLLTYWRALFSTTTEPLLLQGWVWSRPGVWAAVALALAAGYGLLRMLRSGNLQGVSLSVLALAALAVGPVLAASTGDDPRWQDASANPADSAALVDFLRERSSPDDLIVFDLEAGRNPQSRAWWRQNSLAAGASVVGRLRKESPGAEDEDFLLRAATGRRLVWLVLQETPELEPFSTTERMLDRLGWRSSGEWLGAQRVVRYLPPGGDVLTEGGAVDFGANALSAYRLLRVGDDGLFGVELEWVYAFAPEVRFSVQALNAAGQVVAQVDAPPAVFGPVDRVGLVVPGGAQVILKMYSAETGQLFPAPQGEFFTLWP